MNASRSLTSPQNQKRVKEMNLGWEEMAERELVAEDGTVILEGMEGHPDTTPVPKVEVDEKQFSRAADRPADENSDGSW